MAAEQTDRTETRNCRETRKQTNSSQRDSDRNSEETFKGQLVDLVKCSLSCPVEIQSLLTCTLLLRYYSYSEHERPQYQQSFIQNNCSLITSSLKTLNMRDTKQTFSHSELSDICLQHSRLYKYSSLILLGVNCQI